MTMGYMKHHSIVVTSWNDDHIKIAHKKAVEIFQGKLVSEIITGVANSQYSFFIACDGSKEAWSESDEYDYKRELFCNFLIQTELSPENINERLLYCDFVEIEFGGDDSEQKILRSNAHLI